MTAGIRERLTELKDKEDKERPTQNHGTGSP